MSDLITSGEKCCLMWFYGALSLMWFYMALCISEGLRASSGVIQYEKNI